MPQQQFPEQKERDFVPITKSQDYLDVEPPPPDNDADQPLFDFNERWRRYWRGANSWTEAKL
jgi:hypothetical protein